MKTWRMSEMTDVHTHNTLHCNVILCPRPLDNCDVSKLKTKKYPSEICWASQYKCAIPALGRLRHKDKELIDSVYHVVSLRPGCITRKIVWKNNLRAGEVAQPDATRPDDLSSSLRTHIPEVKNWLGNCPLTPTCVMVLKHMRIRTNKWVINTHVRTHIYIHARKCTSATFFLS